MKKIICIDTETTGLNRAKDEILQLAIIDGGGRVLFNERFKPQENSSWIGAEAIHGISPADVANCKPLLFYKKQIEKILRGADVVVGYNVEGFDLPILYNSGIDRSILDGVPVVDVMLAFSPIFGEWVNWKADYKWQKLRTCAEYYHYSGTQWHDALDDTQATLFCFYKIFGNPPTISADAPGVYVQKPYSPEPSLIQPRKKVLTRKQCYTRAVWWFILSCGGFFPVSVYYLLKAIKAPK